MNLQEKYPNLFKDPISIDVDEGWYPLLDKLCGEIEQHLDTNQRQLVIAAKHPEWFEHLTPIEEIAIRQIKEKFGGLRFYYTGGDSFVQGAVFLAEALSTIICERCGAPGRPTGGSWIKTLCVEHANE